MAKKLEGLKQAEIEITLKKLAKFHAASAIDYETNGPYAAYTLLQQVTRLNTKIIDKMVRPLTQFPFRTLIIASDFTAKLASFRSQRAHTDSDTEKGRF